MSRYVLTCPECYGDDLEIPQESEKVINGEDIFRCSNCNFEFPLDKSSYNSIL